MPRGKALNEQMRMETLDKIEKGAILVFAEYGYYGTTMKKIAEKTGLSYGLVYHYFESKEAIFLHIVNAALDDSTETFELIKLGQGSIHDRIMHMSEVLIERSFGAYATINFQIVLQAMTQGKDIEGLKETIMVRSKQVYDIIIPLIIEGQSAGLIIEEDPFALAMTYLSTVQGLALFASQGGDVKSVINPRLLTNILLK